MFVVILDLAANVSTVTRMAVFTTAELASSGTSWRRLRTAFNSSVIWACNFLTWSSFAFALALGFGVV
jgi:hypothetical protein